MFAWLQELVAGLQAAVQLLMKERSHVAEAQGREKVQHGHDAGIFTNMLLVRCKLMPLAG